MSQKLQQLNAFDVQALNGLVWKERDANGVVIEIPLMELSNEKLEECLNVVESKQQKIKGQITAFKLRLNTLTLIKKSLKEVVKFKKPSKSKRSI